MRLWVFLITLILVAMAFSPIVSARQTAEHIQIVTIDPDPDQMVWNSTFNMSDPANRYLSNYNQTIIPFMNNTSIDGVFTGTFLPPMTWKVADDTSFDQFIFMQLVRFKSSWIMSGSSVSWWRVPVLNITDWDSLTLFLWRVGNPGLLSLDASQPGVPNPASRPLWVYSENYWAEARNDTWYEQNVTAWGQNFTHYWLRVDAPIHSDETYLVGFYVDGSATVPGIRCQFAQTDLSEDQLYESYIHNDGSYTTLECDLDISVIHQYGMGHTVSGWDIEPSGGGGGGDAYMPSNQDDMTDALSPTGTGDGGIWDGDWITFNMNLVTDGVTKTRGSNSIKGTSTNTPTYPEYTLDSPYDITSHDRVILHIYPVNADFDDVRVYLINHVAAYGGYYQNVVGLTVGSWNEIDLEINDGWGAWTSFSGVDPSNFDMIRLYFYNAAGSGDIAYVDEIFFQDDEGGGGSANSSTIKFYSRTSENVTNGEYVTFMMPFIKDITNASNAEVTIKNINGSWEHSYWVAEGGPTDFAIKSWQWSESYSNQVFMINVTFQNQSNMIFIHDIYSDNYPWWNIQYPEHYFQDYYPEYVNYTTTSWRHLVWFRPYHSLQVTDGEWVNTILDPLYFLDGRLVDPDTLKFKVADHTDSFVMKLINSTINSIILMYNIADILFYDKLPDLDRETLEKYFVQGIKNLKDVAEPIFVLVGYIVEAVKWVVDAFSQLAGYVLKIISLVIFLPFFFFTCLITNGTKRFFVIMSRDGPEAAIDYGDNFLKNSMKTFQKLPAVAIVRRIRPIRRIIRRG